MASNMGGLRLPESVNWAIEVEDLFSNFNATNGNPTLPIWSLWVPLQLFEIISIQWGHSSEAVFLGAGFCILYHDV